MENEEYKFKPGDYVMRDNNPNKRGTVAHIFEENRCSVRWVVETYRDYLFAHSIIDMARLTKFPFPGQKKRGRPKKNA